MTRDWSRWPNFRSNELACPCCGRADMEPAFMDRLQSLRTAFGAPLAVTSGFRCPEHNAQVSSTGPAGPHTTGRAVDIAVRGAEALSVINLALPLGFTGLGVAQKGAGRFLHLDDLEAPRFPRPNLWSY